MSLGYARIARAPGAFAHARAARTWWLTAFGEVPTVHSPIDSLMD